MTARLTAFSALKPRHLVLAVFVFWWGSVHEVAAAGKVWIVFFSSHDCPHCQSVSNLIRILRTKYPVAVKKFIVDRPEDYALMGRLESIHSDGKEFAVPVVIVGESILIGEQEITPKLKGIVRSLSLAGGSGLPYLGTRIAGGTVKQPNRRRSERDRRLPSVTEELDRLRALLDRLFRARD